MEKISRRELARAIAAGSVLLGSGREMFGQPGGGPKRKDISSLQPDSPDLVNYAAAVKKMRTLSASDKKSWNNQWAIHTNFCPHGNWWFLPWHRAYLHYFEMCCREVLQTPDFALPYWDWTSNPTMPGPFQQTGSPLNHTRRLTGTMEIPSEFVGRRVVNDILRGGVLPVFYSSPTRTDDQRERSAKGTLESIPHDNVHGQTGGDMGSVPTSPNDPIFWLHHCNIDRIWASWGQLHGNAAYTNKLWTDHALTTFFDPASNGEVKPVTSTTLDAARYGSSYDRLETVQGGPAVMSAVKPGLGEGGKLKSSMTTLKQPVKLWAGQSTAMTLDNDFASFVSNVSSDGSTDSDVLLYVEGVEPPKSATVSVRVFLNCRNPGPGVPLDDPSYVGTVGFFGGHDHGNGNGEGVTFVFSLENKLERLRRAGLYADTSKVDVSLVPIDSAAKPGSGGPALKAARVRLVALE